VKLPSPSSRLHCPRCQWQQHPMKMHLWQRLLQRLLRSPGGCLENCKCRLSLCEAKPSTTRLTRARYKSRQLLKGSQTRTPQHGSSSHRLHFALCPPRPSNQLVGSSRALKNANSCNESRMELPPQGERVIRRPHHTRPLVIGAGRHPSMAWQRTLLSINGYFLSAPAPRARGVSTPRRRRQAPWSIQAPWST